MAEYLHAPICEAIDQKHEGDRKSQSSPSWQELSAMSWKTVVSHLCTWDHAGWELNAVVKRSASFSLLYSVPHTPSLLEE